MTVSEGTLATIITTVGSITVAVVSGWVALREHKEPYGRLKSALDMLHVLESHPKREKVFLGHVDEVLARTVCRRWGWPWTIGFGLLALGYLLFTASGFVPPEGATAEPQTLGEIMGLVGLVLGVAGFVLFFAAELQVHYRRNQMATGLGKNPEPSVARNIADRKPEGGKPQN